MSNQRQIRGDTKTNLASVVPAVKELAYNSTDKRLHVGDGVTQGGIPHVNAYDAMGNTFRYASAGGTANALTLTLPMAPVGVGSGAEFRFKATATNTDVMTLNINGGGAIDINKIKAGTAVPMDAGDIVSGCIYGCVYDGTQYIVWPIDWAGAGGGGGEWKHLATTNIAGGESLIAFGSSLITADYDRYKFVLKDVKADTNLHQFLYMQMSTDNGSTFPSQGRSVGFSQDSAGSTGITTTVTDQGNTSDATYKVFPLMGEASAAAVMNCEVVLESVNNTSYWKSFHSQGWMVLPFSNGIVYTETENGLFASTSAVDYVDFTVRTSNKATVGSFSSGTVYLFGYNPE